MHRLWPAARQDGAGERLRLGATVGEAAGEPLGAAEPLGPGEPLAAGDPLAPGEPLTPGEVLTLGAAVTLGRGVGLGTGDRTPPLPRKMALRKIRAKTATVTSTNVDDARSPM